MAIRPEDEGALEDMAKGATYARKFGDVLEAEKVPPHIVFATASIFYFSCRKSIQLMCGLTEDELEKMEAEMKRNVNEMCKKLAH